MKIRWTHVLAVLAAAAAVAAVATGAFAVTGSTLAATDGVITACKHPNGGWIRLVGAASDCRAREQAVSWNAAGSGGGITKLGDLSGIDCTTDSGAAGTVQLDFAGDDTVLFRCVAGSAPPPPPAVKLVINEVDYDQVGADGAGFVEIKNTGTTAINLTGIALVFVDGADSEEYRRESLTGTLAPGGYQVIAVDPQNGSPDGLALVDTSGSGSLLDALSYEGAITSALIGTKTYNLVEGTALAATVVDSNTANGSLIRNPDGKDTNNASADWVFTTTLTRGAANVATTGG